MIILTKEREILEISNLDEILEIAGYIPILDSNDNQIAECIATYELNEKIPCGKSDCRQLHQKGFIVSTQLGNISNIGNICGEKNFGTSFKTMANKFLHDLEVKNRRDFLLEYNYQEAEAEIEKIQNAPLGAKHIHQLVQKIFNPSKVPQSLINYIRGLIKIGSSVVNKTRAATAKEIEKDKDKGLNRPVSRFVTETVGMLQGLSTLYAENNLADLLVINGSEIIKKAKVEDVYALSDKDLRGLYKQVGEIKSNIEKADKVVSSGAIFFTKSNLSILLEVIDDHEDKTKFKGFLDVLA